AVQHPRSQDPFLEAGRCRRGGREGGDLPERQAHHRMLARAARPVVSVRRLGRAGGEGRQSRASRRTYRRGAARRDGPLTLLDTHALVWAMSAPAELSPAARRALEETSGWCVSAASLYEITYKARIGKWPEVAPLLAVDLD